MIIKVKKDIKIGGNEIQIMAGPCAIENYQYMSQAAKACKKSGAKILRGGAFKPRTAPSSFQGLGEEGLKILKQVGEEEGMATITEIVSPQDLELVYRYTDIFQVGARNMQNFSLLEELGKVDKPVLLKRGMSATIKELLLAADYIISNGNPNVILCERGIRTFEQDTRNTLSLTTVPLVKEMCDLPIVVDPSHSVGKPSLIPAMVKAAIACGADGILIEVHPSPEKALCDGQQALLPKDFAKMMKEIKPIAKAIGRKI